MIVATGSLGTFGSSGGPVVDQHGRLIGIMFAVSSQFVFVIPIETAFETLNLSAPSTTDIESNSSTLHGAVFTVRPPQGALTLKDYFVEPSEEFTQPENTSMPLIRYRDVAADEESYSALAGLLNETNAAGFRVIRLNSAIKQGSVSDISIIDETGEERDLALAWNPDQAAPGHAIALVLNRAVFFLLPKTEETVNTRIELTLHLQDGREIMALPERAASGEE